MTARLRLAVMASHRAEELKAAARILAEAVRSAGLEPRELTPEEGEVEYDDRLDVDAEPAVEPAPTPRIFDVEVSDRLAA
jgi:hypothetical protein